MKLNYILNFMFFNEIVINCLNKLKIFWIRRNRQNHIAYGCYIEHPYKKIYLNITKNYYEFYKVITNFKHF